MGFRRQPLRVAPIGPQIFDTVDTGLRSDGTHVVSTCFDTCARAALRIRKVYVAQEKISDAI